MNDLPHSLRLRFSRDERARANFVSSLRRHVLTDIASLLRQHYERDIAPALSPQDRRSPQAVEDALHDDQLFHFYSTLRVTSQDLLYHSVRPAIERQHSQMQQEAARLAASGPGSLTLNADLEVPRSVSAVDIHLMPGSYHTEYGDDDLTMGAVYENRLTISTFGVFGPNLDDIGTSIARFVRERFPALRPRRILDLGCTVGHNTGGWKDSFPGAEVHGIDVAAPCLRYAAARARSQGREIHFTQMNAESLQFPDNSFDVVFSSMFLHEVPPRGIARVFSEAHRVLKPGGLMLHMELPPASQLTAYDSFYLDWDGRYNNEPFYRPFRAQDPRALARDAGFPQSGYVQFVVPSLNALGERAWRDALADTLPVDSDKTGRLTEGVRWFCFGSFKAES